MNRFKLFLVFAVVVTALSAAIMVHRKQRSASPASLASWEVPALLDHLRAAGFDLRAIPTARGLSPSSNLYLTETDKDWDELSRIPAVTEQVGRWRGTLLVLRTENEVSRTTLLGQWGDCCMAAGPYVFFGDPGFLDRLRPVLDQFVASDDGSKLDTLC